ncbi:uncharacterized protein LOC117118618 isoform X2 [Anneissia japonica]|uniref:uncharacterized protein LOC117118618 isoform X2 n=1 Tax=Anneissia japonica TaxID=1529436 RepID=UPI0014257810|nr:uncharacterized protein LOC117118618 isoform X2 [Anneissia japonica]
MTRAYRAAFVPHTVPSYASALRHGIVFAAVFLNQGEAMVVYRLICFALIFQVVYSDCEHGSYISRISNTPKCCVNCKTWVWYYTYEEDRCYEFPNVCKSDSGLLDNRAAYDSAIDVLSDFSTASIQCPSQVIVYSDKGMNSTSVLYNITSKGDIKDESCTHSSGTIMQIGIHLVICTARDGFTQKILHCNFNVSVIDNEDPNIECPNVTLSTIPGQNYTNVTYEPVVWDNSGEILEPKCSLAQGSGLFIGLHPVSCDISDRSWNNNSCSGSVFVQDNESPKLECPNVNVSTIPGKNYTNVTYEPVVWDNSGETLEPKCSLAQGSTLSIGSHSVICDVNDRSQNNNSCSGSVFVQDNEIPDLECPNVTVSAIPGKHYVNVTYKNVVRDNSGEILEPECSPAQGSRLENGPHLVTCQVSDRSLNVNNCSFSVLVQENSGGKSKSENNRRDIALGILVPATVFVTVLVIAFICYNCRTKHNKKSQQKLAASYHSSTDTCLINMDKDLIKNKGATFADFSFADLLSKKDDLTKVDISWKDKNGHTTKTIEKGDFSEIMIVTDLTPNEVVIFKLTYHSNDGTQEQDSLQLKTHRNLSEIFGKCEFVDITYNSVRVKLQYAKEHLTCNNVWLVLKGVKCNEPDKPCSKYNTGDHYSEQKIDASSGITENTFNDLIPGHQYQVFVEFRTQKLLVTVKDPYDLGRVETKIVSIKDSEDGSSKVTVVFNELEPDCKLIAVMCCGTSTTTDNCILTIENLQQSTSYTLTYGAICNGKPFYHGQRTIFTTSEETKQRPGKCEENILDVFDRCSDDADTLITGMRKIELFVERLAKALKFDKSVADLKHDSRLYNYKTIFQGLIQNRRTYCLDMNVDKFLELFIAENQQQNGYVMGDESEPLLTADKENLNRFYQLIEKTHKCDYCQQLYFHSKIHDDTYIENQLKCHQESM